MGYSFVLYKHGPYSFDLKLDTSRLLGRRMLKQEPSAPPYGPRLRATTIMSNHVARHHEAIGRHSKDITRVVQFVGSRGVAELERLSTALYVTVRNEERIDRIPSEAYTRAETVCVCGARYRGRQGTRRVVHSSKDACPDAPELMGAAPEKWLRNTCRRVIIWRIGRSPRRT